MEFNLFDVAKKFKIKGEVVSCEPYGNGHINKTYLLKTTTNDYILQQINSYAFKDVDLLMNNIAAVTEYLASINQETMVIIKTIDNNLYFKANEDAYFRIYDFVMNSVCYESVTNSELLVKDGQAFGMFHKYLAGLDASKIGEVIVDFHNTPKRYRDFVASINKDIKDRKKNCLDEIAFVDKYKNDLTLIIDGINNGTVRKTVTHNDPKINNVLFDKEKDSVRCIIDLDTIMPGSVLYDVGDAYRSLFTGANEDSTDLSLLKVNYDIFRNYIHGYLSESLSVLTSEEIKLIPYSAFLLTIECGIRFLTDYLDGDVYFHTKYPEHNLVRCRTQFALADDIYHHFNDLSKIVEEEIKSFK